MHRISSRWTFFHKRISPVFSLVIFAGLFMDFLWLNPKGASLWMLFSFGILIAMIIFQISGFFSKKKSVFRLADEVWEAEDHLVVKNKGTEEKILFSDIQHVQYVTATRPSRITLTLDTAGQLGRKITFAPLVQFKFLSIFENHPIATELIDKITLARPS